MNIVDMKRNECKRLVRMSNRRVNEIRHGENEGLLHRKKKEEICAELEKKGKNYICEAIFNTGGRADILVLDDFTVIEICVTEKIESIKKKALNYPEGLEIEVVECRKT